MCLGASRDGTAQGSGDFCHWENLVGNQELGGSELPFPSMLPCFVEQSSRVWPLRLLSLQGL